MEIRFDGKRALVTGASQGIGRDLVKALAKGGAKVIAVARNKALLESLKKEVPSIQTVVLDVSDWQETEREIKKVLPIDLLVNNAGVGYVKPLSESPEEDYDRVFNVNIKGLLNVTRIVTTDLVARKTPGSVVNISSQASLAGLLNHTIYAASKGAVDAFTRAAALEFGPHNIRVNCVNPTVIMTAMGRLGWSDPKVAEPFMKKIPLGRFGEVEEVVNAILFLLSDKSSMITGIIMPIDGGFTAV